MSAGQVVTYALAHGEGAYIADADEIAALEARAASRSAIATPAGESTARPTRTARSNNIAGVYNAGFNVLGLMPHPENLIDPLTGGTDGPPMFAGLAAA